MKDRIKGELEKAYEKSKSHKFKIGEWTSEEWESVRTGATKLGDLSNTGVK
jgi:hypothetical protein